MTEMTVPIQFESELIVTKIPRCPSCLAANPKGLSFCPECDAAAPPKETQIVKDLRYAQIPSS